jgi:hypothetical protein
VSVPASGTGPFRATDRPKQMRAFAHARPESANRSLFPAVFNSVDQRPRIKLNAAAFDDQKSQY